MFEALIKRGFQFEFSSHAAAILALDFPDAIVELEQALDQVSIPIEEIIGSGGGRQRNATSRRALSELGWRKTIFTIEKRVNGTPRQSVSHEIDHVRTFANGVVALEIEWNNKDPFFDRDLENFKRSHGEGAISVGVIVTRGASLQAQMESLVKKFADERQLSTVQSLLDWD